MVVSFLNNDIDVRINRPVKLMNLNFYPGKANYMFLRATNGWISHGPKEIEDLAFEFHKATSGTSFRSPR